MHRVLCASLVAVLSLSANAEGFDYDFIEIDYSRTELQGPDFGGSGLGIGSSLSVAESVFLFAAYRATEFDFSIDRTSYGAGVGYNYTVNPSLDLVTTASWQYAEFESPVLGSADDSGLGLGVGFRIAASEQVEINAGLDYVDVGDSGNNTSLTFRGLYNLNAAFALGLSGSWNDDEATYTLGVRLYFGEL